MPSRKLLERAAALLKKERGFVRKEPGGKLNVCLVYPNTYHVGMSNLGFQGVYGMLNTMPEVLCERAFLPDAADIAEFERTRTELFALESGRPLSAFDMIAFSVPFENDYPNILRILRLANIPFRAKDRRGGPLLLLGGVTAFSNPEPVADFFDVVFVGEAEELLPPFIEEAVKHTVRDEFLGACARVEGIYVPAFYEVSYLADGRIGERRALGGAPQTIRRRYVPNWRGFAMRHSILTPETEFANMRLIELQRGCPWNCAFCLTGQVYNPPRKKPADEIRRELQEAAAEGARVGLIGPSVSDYPGIAELLGSEDVEFSITSLRAGQQSIGLLPALSRKHKSLSIAAEAGTERLRRVINKRLSEEDILSTSVAILKRGMNLRLYFMVGLPTETDEDVSAISALVRKIRDKAPGGKITLTVSTFVPKPFTPFQWHPMAEPAVVKKRLGIVKNALKDIRGASVFHDVPKYACMQGVFAMGDRRISAALEKMADGDLDYRAALKQCGLSEDFYIFRNKGLDETLPWDFIDAGVAKSALWEAYQKGMGSA